MTTTFLLAALDFNLGAVLIALVVLYLITLERRPRYIAAFFTGISDLLVNIARLFRLLP